jgi:ketosteroid isomerase-like protein
MSEENVEIVQRLLAATADSENEVALSLMHADIEWQTADDEPDAGTLHGHAQVVAMFDEWRRSFENFSGTPQEFIDAGDDVIVPLIFAGTPRGGGAQVTFDETQVYTVQGESIVKVREFRTKAQALEAVGLSE